MTRSGRKIVVRIKKGGGSKTTAAINLATSLHQKGKDKDLNVLLVDLDPQANATLAVGIDPRTLKKNINHLLIDLSVNPKEVIVQTSYGLDLLPSHPDLSNTESGMQATQLGVVRSLLEPIEEFYDFIILDTPPAKSYLSVSAVVAADEVLLPLQVHYLALQGLGETLDEIDQIRKGLNPTIKVAGVLPVMYNKYTNIGKAILHEFYQFGSAKLLTLRVTRILGRFIFATKFTKPARNSALTQHIGAQSPGNINIWASKLVKHEFLRN